MFAACVAHCVVASVVTVHKHGTFLISRFQLHFSHCVQYFLGRLSRPVIGYRPGDVNMAATSVVEAAAFGTRKTGIKRIRTI